MAIYYMAINGGDISNMPVTPALNLQYGVKVYTDMYPLNENTQLVCPNT